MRDKLEAATRLAERHKRWEPNMQSVYLLEPVEPGNPNEPIKLLEVVEGAIERGIVPIGFAPDPARGLDYVMYVVEVSPREFRELQQGEMTFGQHSWSIGPELAA